MWHAHTASDHLLQGIETSSNSWPRQSQWLWISIHYDYAPVEDICYNAHRVIIWKPFLYPMHRRAYIRLFEGHALQVPIDSKKSLVSDTQMLSGHVYLSMFFWYWHMACKRCCRFSLLKLLWCTILKTGMGSASLQMLFLQVQKKSRATVDTVFW